MKNMLILVSIVFMMTSAIMAFNAQGEYNLVNESTAIQRQGSDKPFMTVEMLPDTFPVFIVNRSGLKFENKKFHFISISPDQNLIAFACGEGNQWLGMMNLKERYLKFILWGYQTKFVDATWSPDSKYLSYAFTGPDRRTKINIIKTLGTTEIKPELTNTWFTSVSNGEQYNPIGWIEPGDTIFTFSILDSKNNEIQRINLPLHLKWEDVPEEMKKEKRKPSGAIQIE